jgi:ankyrin repeat protein
VVLYFKFRKRSSRNLWHAALKRARAKAVKYDEIINVEEEEEDQGRGEEAMGGLSAAHADFETSENKGAKTNLQALLARGGDVNVMGSNGLTCLHLAALNGFLPSLLELLKVKGLLLEVRSDTGQTPLNVAVLHGKKDAVQALLQAGAHDV